MSLQLSNFPKFRADIQSKETQLVPLVVLDDYYISTNSQAVTVDGEAVAPLPILLNVPSLKESIDIDKRNFRISSVTLQLSNFTYDNVRFSDRVGNNSLINKECKIYWTSPSATSIRSPEFIATEGDGDDNAFLIYNGILRKYQHSDEKVTLTIEDMSQSKLHKDLPLQENYLGTDESIPSKYRNKPIPMVYGHVDRSPCVINANYASVIADSDVNITYNYGGATDDTFSDIASPLYMHMDMGGMLNVLKGGVGDQNTDFESYTEQFSIIDNKILLNFNNPLIFPIDLDSSDNSSHILCLDSNKSFALNITTLMPDLFQAAGLPSDYWGPDLTGQDMFTSDQLQEMSDSSLSSNQVSLDLSGYVYKTASLTQGQTYIQYLPVITFMFNYSPTYDHTSANVRDFIINGSSIKTIIGTGDFIKTFTGSSTFEGDLFTSNSQIEALFNYDTSGGFSQSIPIQFHFPHGGPDEYDNINYFTSAKSGRVVFRNSGDTFSFTFEKALKVGYSGFSQGPATLHPFNFELEADLAEFSLSRVVEVEKIFENEFYADVQGRISNSPTSIQVIKSILLSELGYFGGVNEPSDSSYNWQYAFTINKKINSKKLIEGIASVSPYLPRFDNMGKFTFDEIKKVYGTEYFNSDSSAEQAINIKALDVIDYSFSRTDIENVYTKVIFKYNWDYAKEEFLGTAEAYIDNNEQKMKKFIDPSEIVVDINNPPTTFPEYQHDYYGFKTIFGGLNVSHEDSTLVIDDDRGKYIRNETTAGSFASWFLEWHCNQHLKMKVKLPLSYMNIEIGKLVCFDEVIGDVKPYGIDYHKNALFLIDTDQVEGYDREGIGDVVNGQQVFPIFMVIATNKKLDNIEIECIQMHNLENTLIGTDVIFGCTDPNAWNHNPEATHLLPNSCFDMQKFEVPFCGYAYHPAGVGDPTIIDLADNAELQLAYIDSNPEAGRIQNPDGVDLVFFVDASGGVDEQGNAKNYWENLPSQTRQDIIEHPIMGYTEEEKQAFWLETEGNDADVFYREWAPRIFKNTGCNWTEITPSRITYLQLQFTTWKEQYLSSPGASETNPGNLQDYPVVRYTIHGYNNTQFDWSKVKEGSRVEHTHHVEWKSPFANSGGECGDIHPSEQEIGKIRIEVPLTREMREDLIWMRDHPLHYIGMQGYYDMSFSGWMPQYAPDQPGYTPTTKHFYQLNHGGNPNQPDTIIQAPRPRLIIDFITSYNKDAYDFDENGDYNISRDRINWPNWGIEYPGESQLYDSQIYNPGVVFPENLATCHDLIPTFEFGSPDELSGKSYTHLGVQWYHPSFKNKSYYQGNVLEGSEGEPRLFNDKPQPGYAGELYYGSDFKRYVSIIGGSLAWTYNFRDPTQSRGLAIQTTGNPGQSDTFPNWHFGHNSYRIALPNLTLRKYNNEIHSVYSTMPEDPDWSGTDFYQTSPEFEVENRLLGANIFENNMELFDFDSFGQAGYSTEPLKIELNLALDHYYPPMISGMERLRSRDNHIEIVFYTPESEADEDDGSSNGDGGAAEYLLGDLNNDGGHNVIDIVALANCILTGTCEDLENPEAGDLNGDGGYNVIDVVTLANCILQGNCEEL